jgi:hypothetical protein
MVTRRSLIPIGLGLVSVLLVITARRTLNRPPC